MATKKEIEAIIKDEYLRFDTPSDQIVKDPRLAKKLFDRVDTRLENKDRFADVEAFSRILINIRRRGSEKGGLPKLRNGHGPGGRKSD